MLEAGVREDGYGEFVELVFLEEGGVLGTFVRD